MRPIHIIPDLSGERFAAFGSEDEQAEILIASHAGNSMFSIETHVSWPRFINDQYIVFHNDNRNTIGVLSIEDKAVKWEKRLIGSGVHWFSGGTGEMLVVQHGSTLAEYEIESGELLSKSKTKTELCGLGQNWKLLSKKEHLCLEDDERNKLWEG